MAYSEVTIDGTYTLQILSLQVTRKQKTVKQVVGKTLTEIEIIGKDSFQKELQITGLITADSTSTLLENKNALIALDDLATHAYVDGVNDGTYYIVPDSIEFSDSGTEHLSVSRYRMNLIEA